MVYTEVCEFNYTSSRTDVTHTVLEVKMNLFGSLEKKKNLTYVHLVHRIKCRTKYRLQLSSTLISYTLDM